jgi:D-arabinose 1-dehydrogenase-like Zn-dependent alcohol dehydrogenase
VLWLANSANWVVPVAQVLPLPAAACCIAFATVLWCCPALHPTFLGPQRVSRITPAGSRRPRTQLVCAAGDAAKAVGGTPVPKNSILVVGGTGTLGRQVVRRALDEGYEVRCIVRPRLSPADFLRDWGATTVQADLTDPSSLPAALVGVSAVIDCATARPEESTDKVDWEGKVALIQCAQAMGIQR